MLKALCTLLFIVIYFPVNIYAQIITTFAGGGTAIGDGGPAVAASLTQPFYSVGDPAGNRYIADYMHNRIRKVDPSGIITTIAGTGAAGFSGDGGPATAAELYNPIGITMDGAGNLYFSDFRNYCIRKISITGIITTIAGTPGTYGYSGDGGPATLGKFWYPTGIAIDAGGNVYVADEWNNRIRKVSASGIITTIAGNGPTGYLTAGYSGDGGPATAADINFPTDVMVDASGNVLFDDAANQRVRKIALSGIITTVAGNGVSGFSGDGGPATVAETSWPNGVCMDAAGNLYIAEQANNRIRKVSVSGIISTIAGNGTAGFSGDGGPAIAAELNACSGVDVDAAGNIYIGDVYNNRVRVIRTAIVINHAPSFTAGASADITVCENSGDYSINSILAVLDSDAGQTEIWGLLSAPLHGTAFTTYTATSTGGIITPAGLYYTPAGGYIGSDSFKVSVTDGTAADTITVYVTVTPLPAAITGDLQVCAGGTTILSNATAGGNWSSGNMAVSTIGPATGVVTGVAAGTAVITYTTGAGCFVTTIVTVNPLPSAISGTAIICAGAATALSDAGGGAWSSSNASIATINAAGVVTGIAAGMAVITYTLPSGCYTIMEVSVADNVTLGFTWQIKYGCRADTVLFDNTSAPPSAYVWAFGDGSTSTMTNPIHIYPSQFNDTVTLFTNPEGCKDSDIQVINHAHYLQTAFTATPVLLCQEGTVNFTDASVDSLPQYAWHFGDGAADTLKDPAHTYLHAGTYSAYEVVTDFLHCRDTAYTTITVDSLSPIHIDVTDTVLCIGTSATFTGIYAASGNTGITWSLGNGDSIKNTNPVIFSYSVPGTYTITAKALYSVCPDTSASRRVTVIPLPLINLGPDTGVCNAIQLSDQFNAGNSKATWLWNTGNTTSGITVTEPGVYSAIVTLNGCKASDSVLVRNNCYIDVPNAFTPNGDGVNDYFFPVILLSKGVTGFKMDIFNRWGEKIFSMDSPAGEGWDGRYNNVPQPEGVFIYQLDATFKDGGHEHHQGNVTLLR